MLDTVDMHNLNVVNDVGFDWNYHAGPSCAAQVRFTCLTYTVYQLPRHLDIPVAKIVSLIRWLVIHGAGPLVVDGHGRSIGDTLEWAIACEAADLKSTAVVQERRYLELRDALASEFNLPVNGA